jgi:hypothetical protein
MKANTKLKRRKNPSNQQFKKFYFAQLHAKICEHLDKNNVKYLTYHK